MFFMALLERIGDRSASLVRLDFFLGTPLGVVVAFCGAEH
jgi:hypothetical protein